MNKTEEAQPAFNCVSSSGEKKEKKIERERTRKPSVEKKCQKVYILFWIALIMCHNCRDNLEKWIQENHKDVHEWKPGRPIKEAKESSFYFSISYSPERVFEQE